jgi:hypothetical protein
MHPFFDQPIDVTAKCFFIESPSGIEGSNIRSENTGEWLVHATNNSTEACGLAISAYDTETPDEGAFLG